MDEVIAIVFLKIAGFVCANMQFCLPCCYGRKNISNASFVMFYSCTG